MNLTKFEQAKPALIEELVPLALEHCRIDAGEEQTTVEQYLQAAVDSAEHYLDRDVWPTLREYSGTLEPLSYGWRFRFWRGVARNIKAMQGAVDITANADMEYSADPRTWGFIMVFPNDPGKVVISFSSGYATKDAIPSDLLSFILTAMGWLYEMRELANYTAMVQPANVIPEYLLQSWANQHFA